jgi:hypothetical protein
MHALGAGTKVLAALAALASGVHLRIHQYAAARAPCHLTEAGHVGILGAFGRDPASTGGSARRALGPRLPRSVDLALLPRRPTIAVVVLVAALLVFAVAHVAGRNAGREVTAGSATSLSRTARKNKSAAKGFQSSKVPQFHGSTVPRFDELGTSNCENHGTLEPWNLGTEFTTPIWETPSCHRRRSVLP